MSISRDDAWALLTDWTETDSLRKHARAVELVMRAAAPKYGEPGADPIRWGIAGMLHDADYEKWPDEHPRHIIAWLRERGEEALAHAIACHSTRWGVEPKSALDKALLACDELTGFIVACCWLRPDGITTLEPASVLKKLKDKKFAAGVDRAEVAEGVRLLGVDLAEHAGFIIAALRERAEEFGLTGKAGG